MKLIGITGGVGAGKSELLNYIKQHYNCRILKADEAAHMVKQPGTECYDRLISLLGIEIAGPDGRIDRIRMAEKIFADNNLLQEVNELIHPAVKDYILKQVQACRKEGKYDYFFVEAALLIEDGYGGIVDEMWYICANESVRRNRLKASRYYDDEKIDRIMANQLKEEEFRKHVQVIIDNSGTLEESYRQIDGKLGKEHGYNDDRDEQISGPTSVWT